jgi:hypothetical protein
MLAISHNYLIRSGQLSIRESNGEFHWTPALDPDFDAAYLLDTSQIRVRQVAAWNSLERKEIRAEIQTAVDSHQESPEMLWLFDHELDDTPQNRAIAREAILENLETSRVFASRGYGLQWAQLNQQVGMATEDEGALYTPDDGTATTAAKGLNLKTMFPGRALVGVDSTSRKLRERARSLADQEQMTIGQVRELDAWHQAHAADSMKPVDVGRWGDDSDPSGPYITYLTQGGDSARAWLAAVLSPAQQSIEVSQ